MVSRTERQVIPLIKPAIPFDAVAPAIREILGSGQLTSGKYVAAFERAIADYAGTRHARATTSATQALPLTLVDPRVGEGAEDLVLDFRFPASGLRTVDRTAGWWGKSCA